MLVLVPDGILFILFEGNDNAIKFTLGFSRITRYKQIQLVIYISFDPLNLVFGRASRAFIAAVNLFDFQGAIGASPSV